MEISAVGSARTATNTKKAAQASPADSFVPSEFHGYKRVAVQQLPHPIAPEAYYDLEGDRRAQKAYYGNCNGKPSDLRTLVQSSHRPIEGGYEKGALEVLYAELDRHPDGVLRCVYSQRPLSAARYPCPELATLESADLKVLGAAVAPEVLGAWLAFRQGMPALNCEHVVPQDCFNRKEPMRSDLHHLFACDNRENSRRDNTLYGAYVPVGGKGKVARATLYFLLRYPEIKLPYSKSDIEMLKQWSQDDPPDAHEKHRNAAIFALQGNRNPYVDHPEWVSSFHNLAYG